MEDKDMQIIRLYVTITVLLCLLLPNYAQAQQQKRPIVRLIYFLPRDRQAQPDIDEKMDTLIKDVQQAYAGILEDHGFGRKTFKYETNARGKAIVHRITGRFTDSHYSNLPNTWDIWDEFKGRFDLSKNIYLTAIDISSEVIDMDAACGRGGSFGAFGGAALIPASGGCFNVRVAAHELGHAFGLQHDYRGDAKRVFAYTSDWMITSFCAAEWLSVHRAFNPNRFATNEWATIEMLPPRLAAPPNAIRFRFKITDPDGLHQAQLHTQTLSGFADGFDELISYKSLSGRSSTIEFITTTLGPKSKSVKIRVIDADGHFTVSPEFPVNIASLLPPARTVSIPDPNLAAAIRREIGNSITTHTLLNLTRLDVPNSRITDLTGLEHAVHLRELNLSGVNDDIKGWVNSNTISDFSPLAALTNLGKLELTGTGMSDLSPLSGMRGLIHLELADNNISDLSPLSGLTQLGWLELGENNISDISPLSGMVQLAWLNLNRNAIVDVSPLVRLDSLGHHDRGIGLMLWKNPLSYASIYTHIPVLQAKNVNILFDNRTPTTLVKILGTLQQGTVNSTLPLPFVVEVQDDQNQTFEGVPVTFTVTTGNGKLNVTKTMTDTTGRAEALLTLGQTVGTTRVRVSAAKISQPVEFTATAVLRTAPVTIPDAVLRAEIARYLRKPRGELITMTDMLRLTVLSVNDVNIHDLTGLEHAVNLTTLSLNNNRISDVTPLATLSQLTNLSLNNNRIIDVSPLVSLTQLKILILDDNHISDASTLAGLSQLETLSINNNNLSDVVPLTKLTRLKTLHLRDNLLSYSSLYTHIPAIQSRGVSVTFTPRTPTIHVKVSELRGVAGATLPLVAEVEDENGIRFSGAPVRFTITSGGGNLSTSNTITDRDGKAYTKITLGGTPGKNTVRTTTPQAQQPAHFTITAISPNSIVTIPDANLRAKIAETLGRPPNSQLTAQDIRELTSLKAPNVNISDLTGLEYAHNLKLLDLGSEFISGQPLRNSNTISDLSALAGLTILNSLNLSKNDISDISPLAGLTRLRSLYLSTNAISDISPLSGLIQLSILDISANSISDISPLAELTELNTLFLAYNSISDISPLAELTQLRLLYLGSNTVSDISPLSGLIQLSILDISANSISDVSPLSGLTQLQRLYLLNNSITDVSPLANLTQLIVLYLSNNNITDISPLVSLNLTGLQWVKTGLYITDNPLSHASVYKHIPAMQAKGIVIATDNRAHPILLKISGDDQAGEAGTTLENPFVVEAQNEKGEPMQGAEITFTVVTGGGNQGGIVAPIITTDANGKAQTTLTLGQTIGVNKVTVTGRGLPEATFTATATTPLNPTITADVNGDGVVDDQDIDAVSAQFGQQGENDADVNGDGVVNIADLILVAGVIDGDAGAPSLYPSLLSKFSVADIQQWLDEAKHLEYTDTTYLRGIAVLEHLLTLLLPKETILLANYPNPFNPETWIPYQLAESAEVTLHIYAVNGKLVRTLALGHQPAGNYQIRSSAAYWDGRNAVGETVASGIYFYTLTTGNFTATRKMLIRK